jgi:site-specific DNA-methyltransferase (adenine-specific)/modification methylase
VSRVEHIGRATLYLGDCRDILPTLGKVDAVVTDPPYGIGADKGAGKSADKWSEFTGERRWDEAPISATDIALLQRTGEHLIVWGGNYFPLPPSPCWLIWDKETAGVTTFADAEVAWTNLAKAMRLKRHLWSGPYMKEREDRHHPTQKPLAIMKWCIEQLPAKVSTVCDPFMGSGTTGVAAVQMGRDFVGIERDERFFAIACKRIEDAQRQGDFFVDAAA